MKFWSGVFGSLLVPIRLTNIQELTKRIEFFGVKSWSTGAPTYNTNPYFVGLETGALPYMIPPSGSLTIEYGTTDTFQDTRNFFLRGASADGYYVISHA